MKKIFLIVLSFSFFFFSKAQNADKARTTELVQKFNNEIGISTKQLNNYEVSSAYSADGFMYSYLIQTYKGLHVNNQMIVLSSKDGKVLSKSGNFIENIDVLASNPNATPSLSAKDASVKALISEKVPTDGLGNSKILGSNKYNFGLTSSVSEEITAELAWFPVEKNGKLTSVDLVWKVLVAPKTTDDMWTIFVNANNGSIITKFNSTVSDNWSAGAARNPQAEIERFQFLNTQYNNDNRPSSPSVVANASYLVIPYPAESPTHPGGTPAVRNNPWTAAAGNASTLGWHSDGTVDYTISRGNNVWATEDQIAANQNTGPAATSTTSPDLTFNFPPNFTTDPRNTAFQQFATTNLFYWNNVLHDMTYIYGFTEPAGNFQRNNLGRGGAQGDDVMALSQSGGSGASIGNNANFSTPADGGRGRMRMYLFDAPTVTKVHVNAPASAIADYPAIEEAFSTGYSLATNGSVTGEVVQFNDATGGLGQACGGAPTNSVSGKIALINRGNCTFVIKVKEAQNAGAIGVIMVNNVAGVPITMGGTDNTITIPAVMVSQPNGAILGDLIPGLNVTISSIAGVPLDGDLDNGIISHEFGHGVSNRFTGGPANSSCLSNAEQAGEGWGDYLGLMMTTNWATATTADGTISRGVGNYATSQNPTTGVGIRYKPYTTDFAVNPLTYTFMSTAFPYTGATQGEVHDIGEIWCAATWEMTWAIIGQENAINPNLYNFTPTTNGGNSISLKLVLEGMKLQPCSPGYIDSRNAIMAADRNLYDGRHACPIWTAFAKRGMGSGASQGASTSTTDQIPSTLMPPAPTISSQPVDVSVAAGSNATFTCTTNADINMIYRWEVSTNGGTTWTPVSPAVITTTLTLNAVTASMNGYKYRCVTFVGCLTTTSSIATLTVTGGATPPVITTNPANATACAGTNVTFTGAATGATSYNWQVSTNGGTTWADVSPVNTTTTLTINVVTTAMNNNQYRLVATNTSGSVNSTAAILTVNATPTAPTVTSTATYCQGATPAALTATGAGLLWYTVSAGGTGSSTAPTVSTASVGTTTYYVSQTVAGCESPRASITITVNATPAAPTATTAISYCQGATATALSATGTGLLWYTASSGGTGSATAPTPSTASVGTTNYYVSQTVTGCESPRTNIAVTITATPAAPTVTTPISYCQGVTANALTASGTGLLWYTASSGGSGSATAPTPSTTAVGSTTYYVSQTTGCESPRVAIVVNVVAGTAAPIVTTPIAYCQGATASVLTATGTSLLWYTASTGGTGSATAPTPSTATAGSITYYVSQTAGTCESPRAAIVVNTIATPLAPTVTTPISYCQGATAIALTATGTNLKWYTVITGGISSATAPIPSTATLGSTTYYVSQSTGVCEGPRASIVVNITAVPAAPTVTAAVAYCQGATATALTATGTGLLWYTVPTGGTSSATAPIPSTATVGTTTYYVSQTTGCEGPRATITVTINPSPAAPTVASPVTYCQSATTVALTATGSNLLWYTVATGGTGTATAPTPSSAAAGTTLYYVSQSASGCEGPRATITVNVTATPTAPTVTSPVTYCQNATAVALSATGTSLKWYTVAAGGTALAGAPTPITTAIGSTTYYVSQTSGTCEGPRAAIVVNVTAATAAPSATSPITYCQNATATALTATGTNLLWYNTATGGTGSSTAPIPNTATVGSTTYYVSQTGTCESARTPIVVNVTTTAAAPTATSPVNYCQGSTATALTATGTALLWYNAATGGTGSATAPIPSTTTAGTTTYYVSQTTGSCESPRTPIVVNIGAAPAITVQPADITSCTTTATFSATATGTNLTYQWQVSTDNGVTYTNIAGATSNTLVVSGLTPAQANNKYRLVVSSASCPNATSVAVSAKVGTAPVVVLTAAPSVNFNPSVNGGLYTTVSPAGTYTYNWKRNNTTIANTTTQLTKANGLLEDFGAYIVTVTDPLTGCSGVSNSITVNDIAGERDRLFLAPNPTRGIVKVSYYSESTASQSRMISVFDAKGARLMFKTFTVTGRYGSTDIDLSKYVAGNYTIVLMDANSKKLASEIIVKY